MSTFSFLVEVECGILRLQNVFYSIDRHFLSSDSFESTLLYTFPLYFFSLVTPYLLVANQLSTEETYLKKTSSLTDIDELKIDKEHGN